MISVTFSSKCEHSRMVCTVRSGFIRAHRLKIYENCILKDAFLCSDHIGRVSDTSRYSKHLFNKRTPQKLKYCQNCFKLFKNQHDVHDFSPKSENVHRRSRLPTAPKIAYLFCRDVVLLQKVYQIYIYVFSLI